MEHAPGVAGPDEPFVVHCRGVTKTYGTGDARVMALRGIDLDVRRGELLMLVGPSGCGKTTLISVIAAILDQDSGKCQVLGRDLKSMDQKERTRFRGVSIGFVFQFFNLLPALNVGSTLSKWEVSAVPNNMRGRRHAIRCAGAEEWCVTDGASRSGRSDRRSGRY